MEISTATMAYISSYTIKSKEKEKKEEKPKESSYAIKHIEKSEKSTDNHIDIEA